jgi:hypothetical protein
MLVHLILDLLDCFHFLVFLFSPSRSGDVVFFGWFPALREREVKDSEQV